MLKNIVGLHIIYSEMRDQVIAPPAYFLLWPQKLSFVLTKAREEIRIASVFTVFSRTDPFLFPPYLSANNALPLSLKSYL